MGRAGVWAILPLVERVQLSPMETPMDPTFATYLVYLFVSVVLTV